MSVPAGHLLIDITMVMASQLHTKLTRANNRRPCVTADDGFRYSHLLCMPNNRRP